MTAKYEGYKKAYYNQSETLSSFERNEDGSLLVHGVIVMAVGTWTDMHGLTTTFTEEVLQRCAQDWDDNAVWTRHAGGAPRAVTEKVGAVVNPRYSPADAAVVADVLLHNRTDTSIACSALVQMAREQGGIKDVSAEVMVVMDDDGTVTDMVFTGLALVEDGACETCRIPAYSAQEESDMADEKKKETEVKETEEVVTEEETPEAETPKTNDDLLELLVGFIENIIPDTKEIIAGILESDGEERIEKIGMLKGCMQAMGMPMTEETYGRMLDDRLAEFSKALDDKLSGVQTNITQYGKPDGLKGRAGADKQTEEQPRSLVMFGRGVPRY